MKTVLSCALVILFLNNPVVSQGTWTYEGLYSGRACDMTFFFTIGSKAYVGGGRSTSNSFKSDFWEFNPATGVWVQKASYLGGNKAGQAAFAINGKGYVGLGYTMAYHNDFYEYNPTTNAWVQKATFPGDARYSATWFTIGNSGFVATGWNGGPLNDCWEYVPSINTWIQRASFPGGQRQACVGFSIGNFGYLTTGFVQSTATSFNDLWQYSPATNAWTQKAPFPGSARRGCAAFVIGNLAYVGLGSDNINYLTDFYSYDASTNQWQQAANFGGVERYATFHFTMGNIAYVGTGSRGSVPQPIMINDVWKFQPQTTGLSQSNNTPHHAWYNATNQTFNLSYPTQKTPKSIRIYNVVGKIISEQQFNGNSQYQLPVLAASIYLYRVLYTEGNDDDAGKFLVR